MAFDFYFAGATTDRIRNCLVKLNANVLKSYLTDKSVINRFFDYKKRGWKGKLMIDNGEFTIHRQGGTINIDEYIDWLNKNDEYIDYAIAVDSIPGKWGVERTKEEVDKSAQKTWENYVYMKMRVKSPQKLLPVFHQGENLKFLRRFLEIPDIEYICLSGSKDKSVQMKENFYAKCFELINLIKPSIKVHCLGSATISNVEKFPFTSTDATSCNMVAAMGNVIVNRNVVYVGDEFKSIRFKSPIILDLLKQICVEYEINMEDLGCDYQTRAIFNINSLYRLSSIIETQRSKFKNRRLL